MCLARPARPRGRRIRGIHGGTPTFSSAETRTSFGGARGFCRINIGIWCYGGGSGDTATILGASYALYRLRRLADVEGLFDANADYLWLCHGGGIAHASPIPRVMLNAIEEGKIVFPRAKFGVFGNFWVSNVYPAKRQ